MGLPTVLIAVRGFEASHMATLSNVTIDVSYSGGEAQTVVDYWTGLVRVTYTDASSKAAIASDVDARLLRVVCSGSQIRCCGTKTGTTTE